jgi:hypothetical protein
MDDVYMNICNVGCLGGRRHIIGRESTCRRIHINFRTSLCSIYNTYYRESSVKQNSRISVQRIILCSSIGHKDRMQSQLFNLGNCVTQ